MGVVRVAFILALCVLAEATRPSEGGGVELEKLEGQKTEYCCCTTFTTTEIECDRMNDMKKCEDTEEEIKCDRMNNMNDCEDTCKGRSNGGVGQAKRKVCKFKNNFCIWPR
mmetsp:Transcript_21996/g.61647  ORF Transcript_21996/g.61647 Transcript_21996/m.61647 type:complete len:111 (-) Transcript_21996:36-368(-)